MSISLSTGVLEWAAAQVGQSLRGIALSMARRESVQDRILRGNLTPAQVRRFAKLTHVPFGLLFLDAPPDTIRLRIPDLRQARTTAPLSQDFFEVLEDATRKQEWFREHLSSLGAPFVDYVGRFTTDNSPEAVADDIVRTIGISRDDRRESADANTYFRKLSLKVETAGILVLKSGIVRSNGRQALAPSEFRGFALVDRMAPLVFINGKDWEIAFTFTLMHEVAHIWIGQSGVSDLATARSRDAGEAFCNQVAAEILVPRGEFQSAFDSLRDLGAVARLFRISRLVVARRALDLGRITQETYNDVARASAAARPEPDDDDGGGNPYVTFPVRNSKRLTTALVNSAMSGQTSLRDAATLLNIRPSTVVTLAQRMASSD